MVTSHELARKRTKSIICDRHVQNYCIDFAKPFADDGKALPYLRNEDKTPKKDEDGKLFDDNLIMRQEEASKGTRNYWPYLFRFNEIVKAVTTSTEDTPEQQISKIRKERERPSDFAKQQRKRYAEQRSSIQRKGKRR